MSKKEGHVALTCIHSQNLFPVLITLRRDVEHYVRDIFLLL